MIVEASSWPEGSYRSSYGGNEKTKKIDIVQGKTFSSNNQTSYNMSSSSSSHYRSPDLHQLPPYSFSTNNNNNNNTRVSKSSKKSSSSKTSSSWSFDDPEMKRRTRVAKYKFYAVEGKVKSSFKKGYRWIKRKCSKLVHGY